MQRKWNLKCTIIPVIIGATGIVTRSLKKNLEAIPGKHSIYSLQKTAVTGTSHIIRKVLQCETWSLSDGDHRWFKRSTRKTRSVTIGDNNNNNNNNNKWNVKTRVIPVIIGATGTISKSFRKYVSNIPGNHDVKELQKTAILGTAHILRKALT